MAAINPEAGVPANAPAAGDPVGDLFARWGLRAGRVIRGWTVQMAQPPDALGAASARFSRGGDELRVDFRRASRAGRIEMTHDTRGAASLDESRLLVALIVASLKKVGASVAVTAAPQEPTAGAGVRADAVEPGGPARFSDALVRVDPKGGDVYVRLSRDPDDAQVLLQVSPAGSKANALARTARGDVSYTGFQGLDERAAMAAARQYARLLESDVQTVAGRYPHLGGAGAAAEVLATLLGATPAERHAALVLDPAGLGAFLAPELVPDGPAFAGYVLRAIHWLPDRQACLLELNAAAVPGLGLVLVVGPAAALGAAFGAAGVLAVEIRSSGEPLADETAHFAGCLLALLRLKQGAGFECRLPGGVPASLPADRAPLAENPEVPRPPSEFPELRRLSEAFLTIGAFRSAAPTADGVRGGDLADLAARLHAERQRLATRTAETIDEEWRALKDEGLLREGIVVPALAMPRDYGDAVAAAATLERLVPDGGRAAALTEMYADSIPRKWVRQLAVRSSANVRLLHTPLEWERLPRLRRMLESLFAETDAAGGSSLAYLGAPTARELFASVRTLAELYEGSYWSRFMPLQDVSPIELAAIGPLLTGDNTEAVVDRFLSPPLFHDLSHGRTARLALFPPNLDEGVTAYLGVRAAPDLMLPDPDEDNGLQAIGWYTQVGQALARVVGRERLVRAYTGVESWSAVLSPALARALVRLGWDDYFHYRHPSFQPRVYKPDAWLKLFFLSGAGVDLEELDMARLEALPWSEVPPPPPAPLDAEMVRDGLRAMCVKHFLIGDWMRVGRHLPRQPIEIDLAACRVMAESAPGSADAAPPAYLFPPTVAAQLRADGAARVSIMLRDIAAIPEVAASVVEGRAGHHPAFTIEIRGLGLVAP